MPRIALSLLTALGASLLCPAAAHAEHTQAPPTEAPMVRADSNVLTISASGQITWNGAPVSLAKLEGLLKQTASMDEEPTLEFYPDVEASYEISAAVLMRIKQSGVTKFGFVGNERYRMTDDED